jgi:hypothetical protein
MTQHHEAKAKSTENKLCFFIAPIGDPDTDVRKRSDQVLKHVVRPAALICGFEARRADEISEPGIITTQIIQHIIDDAMVIADLTGKNPNVFYELAIRHALRKPYAQIIQKGDRIPFDVAAVRTIEVDHRDLDSVDAAKEELTKQMQSMQGKNKIDSPISVAVDLELLRDSDNPEQRQLADVLTGVTELKSVIEKKFSDPVGLFPPAYMRDLMLPMIAELRVERGMPIHFLEEIMYNVRQLEEASKSPTPAQMEAISRLDKICRMYAMESENPLRFLSEIRRRKVTEKG